MQFFHPFKKTFYADHVCVLHCMLFSFKRTPLTTSASLWAGSGSPLILQQRPAKQHGVRRGNHATETSATGRMGNLNTSRPRLSVGRTTTKKETHSDSTAFARISARCKAGKRREIMHVGLGVAAPMLCKMERRPQKAAVRCSCTDQPMPFRRRKSAVNSETWQLPRERGRGSCPRSPSIWPHT